MRLKKRTNLGAWGLLWGPVRELVADRIGDESSWDPLGGQRAL